jgi:hypothetical protein
LKLCLLPRSQKVTSAWRQHLLHISPTAYTTTCHAPKTEWIEYNHPKLDVSTSSSPWECACCQCCHKWVVQALLHFSLTVIPEPLAETTGYRKTSEPIIGALVSCAHSGALLLLAAVEAGPAAVPVVKSWRASRWEVHTQQASKTTPKRRQTATSAYWSAWVAPKGDDL